MEILIVFDTTSNAIGAEMALENANIPVKVMNIPSSIRAGCGISLRVAPQDIARAITVLEEKKLVAGGYYKRSVSDGKSHYAPYITPPPNSG